MFLLSLSCAQHVRKPNLQVYGTHVCNVLGQHILSSYMTQWPLWLSFSTSKPSPGPQGLHIHLLLSQCFPFVLHTHNQVSVSAPLVFVCACFGSCITQILMPFPSTACLGVLGATRIGKCNNQRALVPSARLILQRGLPITDSTSDGADYTVGCKKPDTWRSQRLQQQTISTIY